MIRYAWLLLIPSLAFGAVGYDASGTTGPTGATGATGPAGDTGPTGPAGTTDHSALLNLSADDHAQYPLGVGRAGGQAIYGGVAVNEALTLAGATGHTGFIYLGSNVDFTGNAAYLCQSTTDGTDNKFSIFGGGGCEGWATNHGRGGSLHLFGNEEATNPGIAHLSSGMTGANTRSVIDLDPTVGLLRWQAGAAWSTQLQWTATGVGIGGAPSAGKALAVTGDASVSGTLTASIPAYAKLAGVAGGQTLAGGTAANDVLALQGASGHTGPITLNAADNTAGVGIGGAARAGNALQVRGIYQTLKLRGSTSAGLAIIDEDSTYGQRCFEILNSASILRFRNMMGDEGGTAGVYGEMFSLNASTGVVSAATLFSTDVVADGTPKAVYVGESGKLGFTSSSRRFKQDIEPLAAGAALKLQPVRFAYKSAPAAPQIGMIAEDVEKVVPEVVGHDKAGRPDSIDYAKLVPVLLAEIQAQERRIAALEAFTGNIRAAQLARPAPESPAGRTCATGFCPGR